MKATDNIPQGVSAVKSIVVTREMTVAHFYAHMPEVYGTPMMIYLVEVAAAEAVQEFLPEGWVSVGVAIDVKHLVATPVGFTVTATAEVTSVSDNTILFAVSAHDGMDKIGEGRHVRAAIEVARFKKRLELKSAWLDTKLG